MELYIFLQRSWVIIPSTSKYWDFILIYFKIQISETLGLLMACQSICSPIVLNRKHANAVCS